MKIVQTVKALFDYNARTEEELSFKEDDILYIIQFEGEESYGDKDWWLARNPRIVEGEKEMGWIPSNYVAEVSFSKMTYRKASFVLKALSHSCFYD
jgi:hypothetical protein